MSLYYRSTVFPHTFISNSSVLLTGGVLEAYTAGTSTPQMMYSDTAGTNAGTSITLNARGEPAVSGNTIVIFLKKDVDYKFILKTADATTIWTADNVSYDGGIDDLWSLQSYAGTYLSATTFNLATSIGNKAADYHPGRNVRLNSTTYATVLKSNYNDTVANATHVTLYWVHDNTHTAANVPSPITSIELGPEVNLPALNLRCLDAGKYGLIPSNGEPGYFDNATVLAKAMSAAYSENKTLIIPGIHAAGSKAYAYTGTFEISNRMTVRGDGAPSMLLCMSTTGHTAVKVTSKQVHLQEFGVQGLSGGGHGFEWASAANFCSGVGLYAGWVDGDGFRITEAQSCKWDRLTVDLSVRHCIVDASLTEGAIKNGLYIYEHAADLNNDHVFDLLTINGSCQVYGTTHYGIKVGGDTLFLIDGLWVRKRPSSIHFNGGIMQGPGNYQGLYMSCYDASFMGFHVEPSNYYSEFIATSGTTSSATVNNLSSPWSTNTWVAGQGYRILFTSGANSGQTATITSNTADTVNFSAMGSAVSNGDTFRLQQWNSLINYLATFDNCRNVVIGGATGFQGDVQLINGNDKVVLQNVATYGIDVSEDSKNCAFRDVAYKHASNGPTGGAFTNRSMSTIMENMVDISSASVSQGNNLRNSKLFFETNFEHWIGGATPSAPANVQAVLSPTIFQENVQSIATSGSTTTLVDTTQAWATNVHAGATLLCYSGLGIGQTPTIISNTATTLTFAAQAAAYDATSYYRIIGSTVTTGRYSVKVTHATEYTSGFRLTFPREIVLGKKVMIRAVVFVQSGYAAVYANLGGSTAALSTDNGGGRRVLEGVFDVLTANSFSLLLTGSNASVVYWDSLQVYIEDFAPITFATIANAAIPDVSLGTNGDGPMIPTVLLSGTTALTQITGMEYGKHLTCYFDGNKTITNGALLQLQGGGNFNATSNDVLVLMRSPVDDIIREVSRSVN